MLMRNSESFARFLHLYVTGVDAEQIIKQLSISHKRYSCLYEKTTRHERDKRRLARRSVNEKQRRIIQEIMAQKQTINRGEVLEDISILLSLSGVLTNMKSYEHLCNRKLLEVRDRLRRNRSDKYQLQTS